MKILRSATSRSLLLIPLVFSLVSCASKDWRTASRESAGYVPVDKFFARTGFYMLPDVATNFTWLEPDGVSRDHVMQFWLKEL